MNLKEAFCKVDSYGILVTPDAVDNLFELRNYIANTLHSPETAVSYIQKIRNEISSLSAMPGRYRLVDEEPWHTRGVRKFLVKNFYVYYRIDETAHRVYILNVFYSKRDQLRALTQLINDNN